MKKLILVLCLMASPCLATDWASAVKYWYYQNVSTNVPHVLAICSMSDPTGGNDNSKVVINWKITNAPPTKAQLIALEPDAIVFWTDRDKTAESDFDSWTDDELRSLCKVLLDEINLLRVKAGLPERTAAQFKQAIKNKL